MSRAPFDGRFAALLAGPLLAALAYALASAQGLPAPIVKTAALTVWVAVWWISEPIPAPMTALLPLGLLPLTGILSPRQVAEAYGNELILLLAGGFMLAIALETNGAHRRLALWLVRWIGAADGRRVLWGFVFASGLTSMWISNTATTLMLMPVALAVLERYPDSRLKVPLVLGVAYAASFGGLGTPIGTPPNLVFMQVYEQTTGTRIGFLEWLSWGIPLVLLGLPAIALWLGRDLRHTPPAELPVLPPIGTAERRVLLLFALVALAWVTRSEPFGGWSTWLGLPQANDASVALLGVLAMALVPNGRGGALLDWRSAERIPWGALLIFAGGIALASAFTTSGLSTLIGARLESLQALPLPLLLLGVCAGVTLLSEIASNTATAVLMMPILAAVALATGTDPALLMLPAALAASLGFMLPVATAPNTIAYATGVVSHRRMLREGSMLDLIGVLLLVGVSYAVFAS